MNGGTLIKAYLGWIFTWGMTSKDQRYGKYNNSKSGSKWYDLKHSVFDSLIRTWPKTSWDLILGGNTPQRRKDQITWISCKLKSCWTHGS